MPGMYDVTVDSVVWEVNARMLGRGLSLVKNADN